ncbi:MAG: hypothetical protein HFJ48_05170, partial [Clostridia bacterium]|nr:hypothetical protein [Clostridia bacterium]
KTKVLKGEDNGNSVVVVIRRSGHVVTVNIELTLKANEVTTYVGFHLEAFPEWATPKRAYNVEGNKVIATAYSQLGSEEIINRPQIWFNRGTKKCIIRGVAKNSSTESSKKNYCTLTYIIDDELPNEDYQLGDINGDGVIDDEDLELLQNYLVGNIGLSDKQKELADVNKDGKLDADDLLKLRQFLNGTITSFD